MHCGRHQPCCAFTVQGLPLNCIDHVTDFGVQCTFNGGNNYHCAYVVSKASKASGAIHRVFHSSSKFLLWPEFKIYVVHISTYCCQAWNTNIVDYIQLLVKVKRRFTKRIYEIKNLPYQGRLFELRALTPIRKHGFRA